MASTSPSSSSSDAEQPAATKRKFEDNESEDDSDSSSDSSDSEAEDVEPAEEDVPVLSHAELRRQKKKEAKTKKPAADRPDTEESATQGKKVPKVKNTAELAPSKVPKRQNSVWVGNLSFKTTTDALRQFFDGVGEITRVHMPIKMASGGPGGRGAVKENRGFAYVDFATPDAKNIAIAMSENHLDGRRLLIKDGGDFTGRPSTSAQSSADGAEGADNNLTGHTKTAQKILRQQKQPAGPTLFLGNLSFEATEQGIQSMLESHRGGKEVKPEDGMDVDGENEKAVPKKKWIRKIRMGTFEDSGKCKGWAFVDFLTTEHATTALTNPKNHFLDGRKLVVEYASPDAVRRGGAGPRGDKDKAKSRPATGHGDQQDAEEGGHAEKPRRERVRPVRKRDTVEDGGDKPAKRRRAEGEGEEGDDSAPRRERRESRGERSFKARAKPGAALANAKRGAVSIVPSEGKKIVF